MINTIILFMKKQLIWGFETRKSVHYWWSYISFSLECKELTRPSITQVGCPTCCYQVCALDHANVGTAELDYSSGPCHRNGSEHRQFSSPRLVKCEAGFPNRRWALIGSNQLWRVNDSPYYWESRGGYSVRKLMGVCRWPLKIGPKKIEGKIKFGA